MRNLHLLPDGDGWNLTSEGGERIWAGIETKEQALSAAIEYATERGASLKIHRADGTIEEERSYPRSADPRETPG